MCDPFVILGWCGTPKTKCGCAPTEQNAVKLDTCYGCQIWFNFIVFILLILGIRALASIGITSSSDELSFNETELSFNVAGIDLFPIFINIITGHWFNLGYFG